MVKSSVPDRKIATIVNTLIGSGFQLVNVTSKPSYLLLRAARTDEFGIRQPYVVAYSGDNTIGASGIAGLKKVAANEPIDKDKACARKYRSYDPQTGKYKSMSGKLRPCRL